jgi:hypothetical protein
MRRQVIGYEGKLTSDPYPYLTIDVDGRPGIYVKQADGSWV